MASKAKNAIYTLDHIDDRRAQVESIQYSGAIKYYSKKRQDFLMQYNNGIKVDNKNLQNSGVIGQAIKEINSSDVSKQRTFINKTLVPIIEQAAKDSYKSQQNSSAFNEIKNLLKQAESATKKEAKALKEKANKQLDKVMKNIFANQQLEDMIAEKCKDQLVNGSYNLKDLQSRARTVRRNMILNLIKGKSDITNTDWFSHNVMAGYYREAIVSSAFARVLGEAAQQTGNQTVSKTIKGKTKSVESAIDVAITDIRDIKKLIQALEGDFTETIDIDTSKSFGIQVKSWDSDRNVYESDLSIGSRANLADKLENKSDWVAGALLFKHTSNVLEALGANNVAWVTGNQFYFTDDFIRQMRQKEYFLNFVYKKDNKSIKATNKVRWQKYAQFFIKI